MSDGWRRNGTGLDSEDFFELFSLNGHNFWAVKNSDGLFESTVFDSAKKYDLLIPSLSDIVDYVNLNEANGKTIRDYIQKEVLITTSEIFVDKNTAEKIFAGILEQDVRIKNGFLREQERKMDFKKFNEWIDIKDKPSLIYEDKNVLELIINRPYDEINSALDRIESQMNKKIYIPSRAWRDSSLSLLIHDNELVIYKHRICGGEFCFL